MRAASPMPVLYLALCLADVSSAAVAPPVGTGIDVHGGSCATPEPEILVHLSATDDVGVTGYYLAQTPSPPSPASFTPVAATATFDEDVAYTIGGGFGEVTLYAWFLDADENVSQPLWHHLAYLDKQSVVESTVLRGSTSSDAGLEVVTDPAGNIYVTGFRFANPFFGGGDRAYVAKFDAAGVNQWERSVSTSGGVGTGLTEGIDIAVDASGTTYTTGYDLVDVQGQTTYYDAFLVKFDTAGDLQWFEPLSTGATRTWGLGVALAPGGSPYVVGQTNGTFPGETNAGGHDAFIARYDTAGNLLWVRQFGTQYSDSAMDVAIDEAGFLYVVGATSGPLFGESNLGPDNRSDIFLSKFDASGNHQWTRLTGTDRSPEAGRNVKLAHGHVYVAGGAKDSCGCATMDIFLAKYTRTGGEKWAQIFGGHVFNSAEEGFGLAVDGLGAAYVVGDTFNDLDGNLHLGGYDLVVSKFGPTGKRILSFTYGTGNSDRGFGAAVAPNGRLLVTGYTGDELHGQSHLGNDDILLLTLDFSATGIPSAVAADGFESGDLSSWSLATP